MDAQPAAGRREGTGMKALLFALLLWACAGCVVIYAPQAQKLSIVEHTQTASNQTIATSVPIEPRVANELTGAAGVQIKPGALP